MTNALSNHGAGARRAPVKGENQSLSNVAEIVLTTRAVVTFQ